jgi:hypothetical protein
LFIMPGDNGDQKRNKHEHLVWEWVNAALREDETCRHVSVTLGPDGPKFRGGVRGGDPCVERAHHLARHFRQELGKDGG